MHHFVNSGSSHLSDGRDSYLSPHHQGTQTAANEWPDNTELKWNREWQNLGTSLLPRFTVQHIHQRSAGSSAWGRVFGLVVQKSKSTIQRINPNFLGGGKGRLCSTFYPNAEKFQQRHCTLSSTTGLMLLKIGIISSTSNCCFFLQNINIYTVLRMQSNKQRVNYQRI